MRRRRRGRWRPSSPRDHGHEEAAEWPAPLSQRGPRVVTMSIRSLFSRAGSARDLVEALRPESPQSIDYIIQCAHEPGESAAMSTVRPRGSTLVARRSPPE